VNTQFETGKPGNEAMTHDWLTPPHILKALGTFDMDPCASKTQPWRTATNQFTIDDDGLAQDWHGRVWCNPPYGKHAAAFLERCAKHGNAIALIFARTETKAFQQHIWAKADALLFLFGRVTFHRPNGDAAGSAGAPSVLVAYGKENAELLKSCSLQGAYVKPLRRDEL
jgi:DNA N-6-adenine-methyltransferase (Dam)